MLVKETANLKEIVEEELNILDPEPEKAVAILEDTNENTE